MAIQALQADICRIQSGRHRPDREAAGGIRFERWHFEFGAGGRLRLQESHDRDGDWRFSKGSPRRGLAGAGEVIDAAGLFVLLERARDGDGADARRPEAVIDVNGGEGDGPDRVIGGLGVR
jgi:hypothetical protein